MERDEGGRFFRKQWIAGVKKYYPGTAKSAYIAPWEDIPLWEQLAAQAVHEQLLTFMQAGCQPGQATSLTREQGGRLVALLWVVAVYRHYPETPKSGYVALYEELPSWQQETDADIYAAIEKQLF